ncbi:MAG: SMC family ATPase [Polyangiaceae bacterium]|nr:SMC family ATPase [Polyangiaceae bacterium]
MRPLVLKLQGLRSYRAEQTIDFTDQSLIAIVGDTGAGKSSLLEAITVALYGTPTWDAREVKQLVSDGETTMMVSLTFKAENKVWRVERAISRGNYPPARHHLECLEEGGEKVEKKEFVDDRIRRLVGLDYDAFLRSVVLPQGRFAALLQAKPAERAQILKGLLRLDRLDQVREQAISSKMRMEPVLSNLMERRAKCLPDPAAAEKDALARLETASKERDRARDAKVRVEQLQKQVRELREKQASLQKLRERALEGKVPNAAADFQFIAERDEQIQESIEKVQGALLSQRAQEEELIADIEEAEKKGAGPVALSGAKQSLSLIVDEAPLVSADKAQVEKDEAAVSKQSADLELADARLQTFVTAESDTKRDFIEKQAEAKRLAEALKTAERLLRDYRGAEREEDKVKKKRDTEKANLEKAVALLDEATVEAKTAEKKANEAEVATRLAMQKHAALHASEGLKAGDNCPVCEQVLPGGWKAPKAPQLDSAQKKAEKARVEWDKAKEALAKQSSKVDGIRDKLLEIDNDLSERSAKTGEVREALTSLLPTSSLHDDDATILSTLVTAAQEAEKARNLAEEKASNAKQALAIEKSELSNVKARLKERKEALKTAKEALSKRKKRLEDAVNALPKDLRPVLPKSGDVPRDELEGIRARLELRLTKMNEVVKRLDTVRSERRASESFRTRLVEERQRDVTAKAASLEMLLATWRERLLSLADALSTAPPPERPADSNLKGMADWTGRFIESADELIKNAQLSIENGSAQVLAYSEEMAAIFASAGVSNEAALQSALSSAEGRALMASSDLAKARADKPIAEALDERISRAQSLVAALGEVVRLVADGKLIAYVVNKRQLALLAVASELLGTMTRGRYGFSEEFEVVDRLSGQARGTRTLSGGETFLASLALALSLVELAGRAGGRLDALFLDEGFGSLDASSLSEALDALTQKAEGGRLVAVISHLRSVAETIDKVLSVRMTAQGSRVAWMSAEDRDQLLSEDVERGLIA